MDVNWTSVSERSLDSALGWLGGNCCQMRLFELALGLAISAVSCAACSIVTVPVQVGNQFQVAVGDQGTSVTSLPLKLKLRKGGGREITTVIDARGRATFRKIPDGLYRLSAGHDGLSWIELDVHSGISAGRIAALRWPAIAPIAVRSLAGVLRVPNYYEEGAPRRLSLEVSEGRSGRLVKTLDTSVNGEFTINGVRPGIYFLRVRLPGPNEHSDLGLIAIELDPRAATETLDVDFSVTSCGLQYQDSNQCKNSEVRLSKLAGRVVDLNGGPITYASVYLFDLQHRLVERLKVDGEGKFESPSALAGTYELVVSAAGFGRFRARTFFTRETADSQSLAVQLGTMGVCSTAELH